MEPTRAATARLRVTPETTIPDLVRSLGDDSKLLVHDEVRLAKLELHESTHVASMGALWLAVGFAAAVVAAIALTVFVATLIGRVVDGHMWLGTLIVGVLDLLVGALLVKRGLSAFAEPKRALEEFRESR